MEKIGRCWVTHIEIVDNGAVVHFAGESIALENVNAAELFAWHRRSPS
jgi:hypothetical protein